MFDLSKAELAAKADEYNFVRDTMEKVLRLADILEYLNTNPLTGNTLALKGGTAINLTVFNLPRLSVDIDLDYSAEKTREEMMQARERITADIKIFAATQGYGISPRSKSLHSLDSFVLVYHNLGGISDNIKIEINYSLRAHIFALERRAIAAEAIRKGREVLTVAPMEIFASKINALLSRAAARDLYDTYYMIQLGLFDGSKYDMLRRCVVFYTAISQEEIPKAYDIGRIDSITLRKIKTDLLPVIRKGEFVELADMKQAVKDFIEKLLTLTDDEKAFLSEFSEKRYRPELLFDDAGVLARIRKHPMALWKMQEH
ncbi:MAG: nucleotidyl transferase AbiEii/AbiGii toxin family protein [Oscillospiraceae bacterium]